MSVGTPFSKVQLVTLCLAAFAPVIMLHLEGELTLEAYAWVKSIP